MRLRAALILAAPLALVPVARRTQVSAQPPAAAIGAKEIEDVAAAVSMACTGCHTSDILEQQRLTEKQWEAVVKKMQGWGSPLEVALTPTAARYLAGKFGPGAGPYRLVEVDARAARRSLAPQPDRRFAKGDAVAGKERYAIMCASCHGPHAMGSGLGMALVEHPSLWRPAEVFALVKQGRGRMPAFPGATQKEIAAILAYLTGLRQ